MKKITLAIFAVVASISIGISQVNIVTTVPATSNGNTTGRAPNGTVGHTVMQAMYNVPAADMAPIATATAVSSFGFQLNSGGATASSGTLTVYLQNSSNSTYTNGTTFSTAGFTQVFTGVYTIPVGATAAVVDFNLPTAFPYTGGALNVAYQYTATTTNATAANYAAYTASPTILGATGASSTVAAPTLGSTTFRPLFRFGTANTYTNDIAVLSVSAPGKWPTTFAAPEVITAQIKNASNIAKTNIGVALSVTGVNTFTNAQFIGSLAAGAITTVTFNSFPTTVLGMNNISVNVLPDDNNTNNSISTTQSVTCDYWAYNPPTGTYTSGVGFNAGSGIISSQFVSPVASSLIAVRIAVSTDSNTPNNPAYGVLLSSTGSVIATTNTLNLTVGMLGTFQTFLFPTFQTLTAGSTYYVGYAQTANTTGYFPIGTQSVSTTPNNYFTSPLAGGSVAALTQNLGYFGIEPAFTSTCGTVGLHELVSAPVVSLYPNPTVNGKATISGLEGTNTITVYNMLGQSVLSLVSDKEVISIDLVGQPVGNYLVKVSNSSNGTKTVKLINQ